jgi:hypothetical protein
MNIAVEKGKIKENKVNKIKLKKGIVNRHFLEIEEVKTLEEIYLKNELKPHQQNVLRYFLFVSLCVYFENFRFFFVVQKD